MITPLVAASRRSTSAVIVYEQFFRLMNAFSEIPTIPE
jgi:hypothetical protein